MTMSRQDFTRLAEWAGRREAELILDDLDLKEGEIIESLADELKSSGNVNYKPDKFIRHAEVERKLWLDKAAEVQRVRGSVYADPTDKKVNRA